MSSNGDVTHLGANTLFWRNIFGESELAIQARDRYREIAGQARDPAFYLSFGVPDTLDGRFEMLCLHAFLVFRHLKDAGEGAKNLAQAIYDEMFQDLDASLRDLGAADMGLGRRIKAMTEGLNGRIQAYQRGLEGSHGELRQAIERNVFGTVKARPEDVEAMTRYFEEADRKLGGMGSERLAAGPIIFPKPMT